LTFLCKLHTHKLREGPMKNSLRFIGYLLFFSSFIIWGSIAFFPLLHSYAHLSYAHIASLALATYLFTEVIFILSLMILGKTFYAKVKQWFLFKRKSAQDENSKL